MALDPQVRATVTNLQLLPIGTAAQARQDALAFLYFPGKLNSRLIRRHRAHQGEHAAAPDIANKAEKLWGCGVVLSA